MSTFFTGVSPVNYEQKCLCTLVLDVSGSMSGQPIAELNEGLKKFQEEVLNDVVATNRLEVSLITFGQNIHIEQNPALMDHIVMPELLAGGGTPLVDAMRLAIHKTEERKLYYKQTGQTYYRPFIVLITDGEPDTNQDVLGLKSEIEEMVNANKMVIYAVGVQGADLKKLKDLMPSNFPPLKLSGLKFSEFFKWLSASMKIISKSMEGQKLSLPPTSGWSELSI